MISTETMRDGFAKVHLGDGRTLHVITEPDSSGAHDHPWAFTSHILLGGYIERTYRLEGEQWICREIHRHAGGVFTVASDHIHEIIALPDGPCVTLIRAGPHERETRFWRPTVDGMESRAWHEQW